MTTTSRAPEALALNNPALTALCITRMAFWCAEDRVDGAGLAWPLVRLALVVCAHEPTRSALPKRTGKTFAAWANEHPREIASLEGRARGVHDSTLEGLRVALRQQLVSVSGGLLDAHSDPVSTKALRTMSDEPRACLEAAKRLGRMLSHTDPSLAFKAVRMTI